MANPVEYARAHIVQLFGRRLPLSAHFFHTLYHRLLTYASVIYVVLMACWIALRLIAFDGFWWLALINTFAIVLFAPLAVLLPLAGWGRRWWLIAALALPVAAFVWLFGGTLLPKPPRPAPTGSTLTVMSLNVLWKNKDYERIARAIEDANPAIVAMQELRPDHLDAIQAALGEAYPYQVYSTADQYHKVGLLSRYPVEVVTPLADPLFEHAIMVRLRVGEQPLTMIVAHLTPTNMFSEGVRSAPAVVTQRYAERQAQARALITLAMAEGQPVILACDCNASATSEVRAVFLTGFSDSFAEAGWGFGHTMRSPYGDMPALRLDYIWHTPELQALESRVGADAGSDHLPVVTRFAWR